MFKIYCLSLEYFVQSPKPLNTNSNSNRTVCRCVSHPLFLQTGLQKMQGVYTCFVWRAVWYLPYWLRRRLGQHFGGFFLSNKRAPANRKRGFYTCRLTKNEEIRGIFVWNRKELWTLKTIKDKITIYWTYCGKVLSWAYPILPRSL